jgi:hypothetical protein
MAGGRQCSSQIDEMHYASAQQVPERISIVRQCDL